MTFLGSSPDDNKLNSSDVIQTAEFIVQQRLFVL